MKSKRIFFVRSVKQAAMIVLLGLLVAFSSNGLRNAGLPLFAFDKPFREISIKKAVELHRQDKAIFIDARDSWSFEEMGHIPRALNIEPEKVAARSNEIIALAKSGKMLISYCDGDQCRLGEYTARKISALGVPNIRILHNGWLLWQEEGMPLEKGEERR